jgi:hypothetical protein
MYNVVQRMMIFWWMFFFIFCHKLYSQDSSLQVRELLAAMEASISQIHSIEVPYKIYFDKNGLPNVDKDDNGEVAFDFITWGYQEYGQKEYHTVRHYAHVPPDGWYVRSSAAYNDELFTSYNFTQESGAIRFDNLYFREYITPLTLLGRDFGMFPDLKLIDTFSDAKIVEEEGLPTHIKKLLFVKRYPPQNNNEVEREVLFYLWIDMSRGFMPIKFYECDGYTSAIIQGVEVTQMIELQPGIWVPTRGFNLYHPTVEPVIEGGLTEEEWIEKNKSGLSMQELFAKAKKEIKWKTKTKSFEIVLDTEKLVLNKPIADDKFTYKFKDGDRIWNSLKGRSEIIGKEERVIDKRADVVVPKTSGNLWRVVVGLAGLSIVVITLFLAYRGRQN